MRFHVEFDDRHRVVGYDYCRYDVLFLEVGLETS